LAAKKLDELWDDWMNKLAESHLNTLNHINDGKLEQAESEYCREYMANIKKLYSEAAKTYPLRFSKAEHWCVWTKNLYKLSRQTEEALKARNSEEALKLLEQIRQHFYSLHQETKTLHCNDLIYEFRKEATKSEPSAEQLGEIIKRLEKAEPSRIVKKKPDEFTTAKNEWQNTITPLLDNSEIAPSERDSLRKATETFYLKFGIQYE
jgi:F0F1-type ATP synthase gamma subunit